MITIDGSSNTYGLPLPTADTVADLLGVLNTAYGIDYRTPVDPNGYMVDIEFDSTFYHIRHFNPRTLVEEDDSVYPILIQNANLTKVILPQTHALKIRKSGDQALASGVAEDITWETEVFQTDPYITLPDTTITIPPNMGAAYQFNCSLQLSKTGADSTVIINVYNDNGAGFFVNQNYHFVMRDALFTYNFSFVIRLPAANQLKVEITMTGGANLTVEGNGIIQESQLSLAAFGTI